MPLALLLFLAFADYRLAVPGYHYQFPRDHFAHAEFQTEWWYYAGNLRARDGHRCCIWRTWRSPVRRMTPSPPIGKVR